ncbi:MAG: hypothetical protein IKP23_00930 [Elusimicrobiaceae bacterium]|jgi:hypothetical protein|nr:hypothetical protein [Elusimicrobiaceae bacterium]
MNKNESMTLTIKGVELDDVYFENLGPLEINALAATVENQINKISVEKKTLDVFKLFLYTALHFAAQAYSKNETASSKKQDEQEQLDIAIDKLSSALSRLPLE